MRWHLETKIPQSVGTGGHSSVDADAVGYCQTAYLPNSHVNDDLTESIVDISVRRICLQVMKLNILCFICIRSEKSSTLLKSFNGRDVMRNLLCHCTLTIAAKFSFWAFFERQSPGLGFCPMEQFGPLNSTWETSPF